MENNVWDKLDKISARMKRLKTISNLTFDKWLKIMGGIEEFLSMVDISIDEYAYGIKEDDYEDDDGNNDEEAYKEALLEAANERLEEAFDDWIYKYDDLKFPLELYRCVALPGFEKLDTKKLGIYWSDDLRSAECHWGGKGDTYTLKTRIKETQIDWESTLEINMHPSLGEDEQEIRLREGTPLTIESYQKDGDKDWVKTRIKGKA